MTLQIPSLRRRRNENAQRHVGHHVNLFLDTDMAELIPRWLDLGLVEDDEAAPHQAVTHLDQLTARQRFDRCRGRNHADTTSVPLPR